MQTIVYIDPEPETAEKYYNRINAHFFDHNVKKFDNLLEAEKFINKNPGKIAAIITEIAFINHVASSYYGPDAGIEFYARIKHQDNQIPFLILTYRRGSDLKEFLGTLKSNFDLFAEKRTTSDTKLMKTLETLFDRFLV